MVKNSDKETLVKKAFIACKSGNLAQVKSLMADINIDMNSLEDREIAKNIYETACFSGHLNIIDELSYLTEGNIGTYVIAEMLENLARTKKPQYYPVISYLVNEPKLEAKRSPPEISSPFYGCLNRHLEYAANDDNLPLVKALLNTHEPEKRNKWVFTTSRLFKKVCSNRHSEVFKYLYTEPKFKNILNPLLGLVAACEAKNQKLIDFLIFDYKLKLTEEILSYLKKSGNKNLISLIEKIELSEQLNTELNHNNEISKRLKI